MLTTTQLPPPRNTKYVDALQRALQLPAGEYIHLELSSPQEARTAKISLHQNIMRNGYAVKALQRGASVYIGRAK